MKLPTPTIQEFAHLYIHGPGKHEQITEILKIKPSQAWNVGDINPLSDKSPLVGRTYKFMGWQLDSGLDSSQPLEKHIESLFALLFPVEDGLRQLWAEYDLILMCAAHFPSYWHDIKFNREQIRQAAQLGLTIDIVFHFISDGYDKPL